VEVLQQFGEQIHYWFKYFKGPDWILPVLGAVAAAAYLSYKLRKMRQEMADDFEKDIKRILGDLRTKLAAEIGRLGPEVSSDVRKKLDVEMAGFRAGTKADIHEAVGSFRNEINKLTVSASDSLISSARKARGMVEASPQAQDQKQQRASEAAHSADVLVTSEVANAGTEGEVDLSAQEKNWGEISAGWSDVWEWTKKLRVEAIEGSTGRAKGHLRTLNMSSPVEVIVKLFNYGWFGDEASDLAIEMAEIYLSHRGRAKAGSEATKRFRKLLKRWNATPD
jgi:hypothetical protein